MELNYNNNEWFQFCLLRARITNQMCARAHAYGSCDVCAVMCVRARMYGSCDILWIINLLHDKQIKRVAIAKLTKHVCLTDFR